MMVWETTRKRRNDCDHERDPTLRFAGYKNRIKTLRGTQDTEMFGSQLLSFPSQSPSHFFRLCSC